MTPTVTANQHPKESSLAQALTLFGSQGGRDHLIRTLEQMSGQAELELAPVLREAIELDDPGEAFLTSKRLLDAQPQWLDAPCGKDGDTPLMIAVRQVNLNLVDLLVERGANLLAKNEKGWTALDKAVDARGLNHRISEARVDAVLEPGAFSARDKSFSLVQAVRERNVGAVRSLLKHGADASFKMMDSLGSVSGGPFEVGNALVAACNMAENDESLKIADMLLGNPRVLQVLNEGWGNAGLAAPIHCAAFNDNPQLLERLVRAGAWINPPKHLSVRGCQTPLMCAALGGAPAIMAWLIAQGADATCVDEKGANAFHYLACSEIDHGEKKNADIERAAFHLLIQAGCDPVLADEGGNTPLMLAQTCDTPSLVRLFAAEEERRRLEQGTGPARGKTGGLRL